MPKTRPHQETFEKMYMGRRTFLVDQTVWKEAVRLKGTHFFQVFLKCALNHLHYLGALGCPKMLEVLRCLSGTWGTPFFNPKKVKRIKKCFTKIKAGPIRGHMLLVLIDPHSKWMEVHATCMSSSATIEQLRITFAQLVVTDNGPYFVSGVRTIHAKEWHSSHDHITISSIVQMQKIWTKKC